MKTFIDYIQMALKYMRRCSASHMIEEMKIKSAGAVSHLWQICEAWAHLVRPSESSHPLVQMWGCTVAQCGELGSVRVHTGPPRHSPTSCHLPGACASTDGKAPDAQGGSLQHCLWCAMEATETSIQDEWAKVHPLSRELHDCKSKRGRFLWTARVIAQIH